MLNYREVLESFTKESDLPVIIKRKSTEEVLHLESVYVANEIIFLFAFNDEKDDNNYTKANTKTLINFINNESRERCWNSAVVEDDEEEDYLDLTERKYRYLTEDLTLLVYYGNLSDCPLRHQDDLGDIKNSQVIDGKLVITIL